MASANFHHTYRASFDSKHNQTMVTYNTSHLNREDAVAYLARVTSYPDTQPYKYYLEYPTAERIEEDFPGSRFNDQIMLLDKIRIWY
jgi:hypothetical protein